MDVKAKYNQAVEFIKEGKYSHAISEFDKILQNEPNHADSLSDRGVAKYHLNDLRGALQDMSRALELEPRNPYRYASRAYIRDRAGDTRGAIDDYRKALDLDPENAVSQNNLGLLEEKLGYMSRAQKRFQLADKLSEDIQEDDVMSFQERDQVVQELLSELNIEVENKEEIRRSLLAQMISIFHSRKERTDFIRFLKNLFRKK